MHRPDIRPAVRSRLAELRAELPPITLDALAARVGLPSGQLNAQLAGRRPLAPAVREALVDLGVQLDAAGGAR